MRFIGDGQGHCRLTSSMLEVLHNADGEYRWPSRVAQTSLYSRALLDSELRSHSTSFWRKPADLVRVRLHALGTAGQLGL